MRLTISATTGCQDFLISLRAFLTALLNQWSPGGAILKTTQKMHSSGSLQTLPPMIAVVWACRFVRVVNGQQYCVASVG